MVIWSVVGVYLTVGAVYSAIAISQKRFEKMVTNSIDRIIDKYSYPQREMLEFYYPLMFWFLFAMGGLIEMVAWPHTAYLTLKDWIAKRREK